MDRLNRIFFETKDILNFESPDWKKISTDPEIFESLRDDIILKFVNYTKLPGNNPVEINQPIKLKFKKNTQVKVVKTGERTIISCKYRLLVSESFELITDDDPKL